MKREPISKWRKITADSYDTGFDPSTFITAKEGTFVVHPMVVKYLDKHMKKCLNKDERKALKQDHPKTSADLCKVPVADKYIKDFLGLRFCRRRAC